MEAEALKDATYWAEHGNGPIKRVSTAYLVLLTQQSQDRAERPLLEADATPIGRDWVEYAKSLEAELDRAVERGKALRKALEAADARFEEIVYAKGSLEEKVERMAQEAYFGQKEVARALAASPGKGVEAGTAPMAVSAAPDPPIVPPEAAPIEDEEEA